MSDDPRGTDGRAARTGNRVADYGFDRPILPERGVRFYGNRPKRSHSVMPPIAHFAAAQSAGDDFADFVEFYGRAKDSRACRSIFPMAGGAHRSGSAMLYGLYHSAQGAQAQSVRIDVLANNLANTSTSGFKRDFAVFQNNRPYDVENGSGLESPGNQNALSGGVTPSKIVTDFSNGAMVRTGSSFDVALNGRGFFQVSDGNRQFLTRNGQFALNRNCELVMQGSTMRLMSAGGGSMTIPNEAARIEIASDGTVTALSADGSSTAVGRFAVVRPSSEEKLQKIGNNLYRATGEVAPAGSDVQVRQGFVEASGVSSVGEMMELIQASRAFETNVNLIKYQDDALGRLLQSAAAR